MAKITQILTTFTNGELTPLLDGRVDVQAYFNGAATIENFFITPYGGLKRRPGTYFVAEVKDSSKSTRLIPFQFNVTQGYIIEFGDLYMRFYMNKGQILDGASPYEISHSFAEADLFDVQYCQDADTMYLVHPSYKPQVLTRTGHTSWTIADYEPTADPFTSENNYPSCFAIYEQRLAFANTNTNPQTIWMSKSGDYDDMTTGPNDDDALQYTLGSTQVNVIKWLTPGRVLLVGTMGGVFSIASGSASEPISPTNVVVRLENTYGCL
jgi:hypothetical protein